jgi:hypothetical protein
MAPTLPFERRPTDPPKRPDIHRLAGKIQILVLTYPFAGRVLEELIDRLLAILERDM